MVWSEVTATDLRSSSALCVELEQCTTPVVPVTPAVPDHLWAQGTLSLLDSEVLEYGVFLTVPLSPLGPG